MNSIGHNAYQAIEDSALMHLISEGNHDAFAALVKRHTGNYLLLAIRTLEHQADAEDVIQASFLKIWKAPKAWKQEKAAFKTWFYQVVLNACRDLLRKKAAMAEVAFDSDNHDTAGDGDLIAKDQTHRQLIEAVHRLPDMQRDVINLVVYCALPQQQVADILGISRKAVESHLARAKQRLQIMINADRRM